MQLVCRSSKASLLSFIESKGNSFLKHFFRRQRDWEIKVQRKEEGKQRRKLKRES
jgi:hypothetical protein